MHTCLHFGGRRAIVFFRFSEDGLSYTVEEVVYSTRGPRLAVGGESGTAETQPCTQGSGPSGEEAAFSHSHKAVLRMRLRIS